MTATTACKLVAADNRIKQELILLLEQNDLPVKDLDDKNLFALVKNDEVVGTAGVEFFSNCALVRSISVKKELQGRGLGKFIVRELEEMISRRGIFSLYLLTTTAKEFFTRVGYAEISRDDVPPEIKNTSEYSTVCPSSATVMKKTLL